MNKTKILALTALAALAGIPGISMASSSPVREQAITSVGAGTTVSISTSVWTLVPASTATTRVGILIDCPTTNNADVAGVLVNYGEAVPATTIRPLTILKANGYDVIPVAPSVNLFLLSLHSSAESCHVQNIIEQ